MQQRMRGFTLLEVTFAILILAGSLVVLLGLQSSSVQRTLRDRNKQQAMLMARQILAAVETSGSEIDLSSKHESAAKLLEDFVPKSNNMMRTANEADNFDANFVVENWPLPNLEGDYMRRIRLTLSWSDNPLDSLSVYYFFAIEPKDDAQ